MIIRGKKLGSHGGGKQCDAPPPLRHTSTRYFSDNQILNCSQKGFKYSLHSELHNYVTTQLSILRPHRYTSPLRFAGEFFLCVCVTRLANDVYALIRQVRHPLIYSNFVTAY